MYHELTKIPKFRETIMKTDLGMGLIHKRALPRPSLEIF